MPKIKRTKLVEIMREVVKEYNNKLAGESNVRRLALIYKARKRVSQDLNWIDTGGDLSKKMLRLYSGDNEIDGIED